MKTLFNLANFHHTLGLLPISHRQVLTVLASAFLAITLLGCQETENSGTDQEPAREIPQTIGIPSPGPEDEYPTSDAPHVFDMCNIVGYGESLILAEIEFFERDDSPCEERPYRLPHDWAMVSVIDHIIGDDYGNTLDVVWLGGASRYEDWEPGEHLILSVRQVQDVLFVARAVAVNIDDGINAIPEIGDHSEIVYDIPNDYAVFSMTAQTYWNEFEQLCGRERDNNEGIDLNEWYFGEPNCPSTDGGNGGQEYNEDEEPNPGEINDESD